MKIAHIADVHLRARMRHEEYNEVFEKLYADLRIQKPDYIVLAGDVVHSKLTMSPELIRMISSFFNSLREIAPLIIIPGNHDMLISNSDRSDALSPIIELLNENSDGRKIEYYTDVGVHTVDNMVNFCTWSEMYHGKPAIPDNGLVNVGLYHGAIDGSELDNEYHIRSSVKLDEFDGMDFVLLGDIHKGPQFFVDKRIAYPGSLIQQNHGEGLDRGYLLWDIRSKNDFDVDFRIIKNDYGFYTIHAENKILPDIELPAKCNLRVVWPVVNEEIISKALVSDLVDAAMKKYSSSTVQIFFKPIGSRDTSSAFHSSGSLQSKIDMVRLNDRAFRHEVLRNWLTDKFGVGVVCNADMEKLFQIDDELTDSLSNVDMVSEYANKRWVLHGVEIENFMSYGDRMSINFDEIGGLVGLFGNNACGKSSVFDAILYALFNKTTRNVKSEDLVNKFVTSDVCNVVLNISIGNDRFRVDRSTKVIRDKLGKIQTSKTDLEFLVLEDGADKWENLNEGIRVDTEKVLRGYFGEYDDFILTTMMSQGVTSEFISLNPSQRTDNIIRFLGLDILTKKYDEAKSRLKKLEIRNNVDDLESTAVEKTSVNEEVDALHVLTSDLGEKESTLVDAINMSMNEISDLKSQIDESVVYAGDEKEKTESEIEIQVGLLDQYADDTKNIKTEIRDIAKSVKVLEGHIVDPATYKEFSDCVVKCGEAKSLSTRLTVEISYIKKNLNELRNELNGFTGCPVSDDSRHKTCLLLTNVVQENLEKIELKEAQLAEKMEQLKSAQQLVDELSGYEDLIVAQNRIQEKIQEKFAKIDELKNRMSLNSANSETKKLCVAMLRGKLKAIVDNEATILRNSECEIQVKRIMSVVEIQKSELNRIRSELLNANKKLAVGISKLEILSSRIEDIKNSRIEIDMYTKYCNAMHRKGIPSSIIDKLIPAINYELNLLLDGVVDFNVYFKLQYDPTVIDIVMKYDDVVDDTRPVAMASGMEKFVINMAIRVVLMKLTNLSIPTIHFVDEGFGVLDSDNIFTINKMLELMKQHFDTIIIITHLASMKDSVDTVINVSKRNGVSSILFK